MAWKYKSEECSMAVRGVCLLPPNFYVLVFVLHIWILSGTQRRLFRFVVSNIIAYECSCRWFCIIIVPYGFASVAKNILKHRNIHVMLTQWIEFNFMYTQHTRTHTHTRRRHLHHSIVAVVVYVYVLISAKKKAEISKKSTQNMFSNKFSISQEGTETLLSIIIRVLYKFTYTIFVCEYTPPPPPNASQHSEIFFFW